MNEKNRFHKSNTIVGLIYQIAGADPAERDGVAVDGVRRLAEIMATDSFRGKFKAEAPQEWRRYTVKLRKRPASNE